MYKNLSESLSISVLDFSLSFFEISNLLLLSPSALSQGEMSVWVRSTTHIAVVLWTVGGLPRIMDHPELCCGIVASSLLLVLAIQILLHTTVCGTSLKSTLLLGDAVNCATCGSFIHLVIKSQSHPACRVSSSVSEGDCRC